MFDFEIFCGVLRPEAQELEEKLDLKTDGFHGFTVQLSNFSTHLRHTHKKKYLVVKMLWLRYGTNNVRCVTRRMLGRSFSSVRKEYLHETYLPSDHFQDSLPTLPIPKLEETLERYEYHAFPLLDEEQRKDTKEAIELFMKNEGPDLQAELVSKFKGKHTSYIREPWFEMYLRARSPLLLNWNPALTFVQDERRKNQTVRAAAIIHAAAVFYRTMRDGKLKPDLFETKPNLSSSSWGQSLIRYTPRKFNFYTAAALGAFALDMSQYPNLFHSTRIPRSERDELVISSKKARHVMVRRFFLFSYMTRLASSCETMRYSHILSHNMQNSNMKKTGTARNFILRG